MFKIVKIIMIPADKAEINGKQIYSNGKNLRLPISSAEARRLLFGNLLNYKPQYLYFLSDDVITEGDWTLSGPLSVPMKVHNIKAADYNNGMFNKIIASTDKSLGLPMPSDEFIQFFVIVGGVYKVQVEFNTVNEYGELYNYDDMDFGVDPSYKLKVKSDNTIIIKTGKDNWTNEEVIYLLDDLRKEVNHKKMDTLEFKKWVEKYVDNTPIFEDINDEEE